MLSKINSIFFKEKCEIASVDCMVVLSFAAFAAFCFAVGFFTTVHYALRKDHEADLSDFKPAMAGIADGDLGNVESLGSWIESQLEVMCAHYGEVILPLILCVGLKKVHFIRMQNSRNSFIPSNSWIFFALIGRKLNLKRLRLKGRLLSLPKVICEI